MGAACRLSLLALPALDPFQAYPHQTFGGFSFKIQIFQDLSGQSAVLRNNKLG